MEERGKKPAASLDRRTTRHSEDEVSRMAEGARCAGSAEARQESASQEGVAVRVGHWTLLPYQK
jgi:hypothetical protein